MKRQILILQAIAVMTFASCSLSEEPGSVATDSRFDDVVTVVNASISDFAMDDGTRTSIAADGKFNWNTDDKLGFWPVEAGEGGSQAIFYVSDIHGNTATFTANSWGLLKGNSYAACYPYDENNAADGVQIRFDSQVPAESGSTAHLGEHDYLHAVIDVDQNGTVAQNVEFEHLGCLTRYTFKVDDATAGMKFKSLSLTASSGEPFVTSATYNPLTAVPSLEERKSSSFTINLGENFQLANDGKIVIFAMMGKSDLSGKTITAHLTASDNSLYSGKFTGKNMTSPNKGYGYSATLVSGDGCTDLSKTGTANCYVVPEEGDYKFKATKGFNGENVAPASVGVYWETYNSSAAPTLLDEIINTVGYNNGYIYFSKPSNVSGNAVIAARDAENNILWTWHIWCVSGLADITTSQNVTVMDRNLGALTADAALATSAGFNYQWGRKDPFVNISDIGFAPSDTTPISLAATNPAGIFPVTTNTHDWLKGKPILVNQSESSDSDYYVKNPTHFCKAASAVSGFSWSGDAKTSTDPCPPGYRVAQSGFVAGNDVASFPKAGEISGKTETGGQVATVGAYGWSSLAAYIWTNDDALNRRQLKSGVNIDAGENRIMSGGQVRCQKIQ